MEKNSATVAVITRTKNRVLLLRRAVESVLDQEMTDWIHVIVNDGGDPEPVEALLSEYKERYGDRLTVVHNGKSLGMEAASNVGVHASQSRYLIIHDDDDSWHPSFLSKSIEHLTANTWPDTQGVVAYSVRVLEKIQDDKVEEIDRDDFNTWMQDISLVRLASSNTFPPISFLFSRLAYDQLGGFDENLPVLGDWDFHLRFASLFEITLLKECLAYYHHRVEDTDSTYGNSVIAGATKHDHYRTLVINRFIREDIKNGRVGIGGLMTYAPMIEEAHAQFFRANRAVHLLRSISNKIPLRWLKRWIVK